MRDLIRISDEELHELSGSQRLRIFGAISIVIACGIVSLQGMIVVFTDARVVPLPGMNQLAGQIVWAIVLVAMIMAVTMLVRGVIKRRLQWAIVLSLLLHFLLCVSMSVVKYHGPRPIPATAAEMAGATPEEFTLPDYAGEDAPNSETLWQQTSETVTPENNVEVERSEMEIADADKPEPENPTKPEAANIEMVDSLERQEQVNFAAEATAVPERESAVTELPPQTVLAAPDIATTESPQPEPEPLIDPERRFPDRPTTEREQTTIASADQQLEATKLLAQRIDAEIQPEDVPSELAPKANVAPAAVLKSADEVDVTSSDTPQVNVTELPLEIGRQQAASASGSTGEPSNNISPTSAASPAFNSELPNRAAAATDPATDAPTSGGSVSMDRSNPKANATASDAGAESVTLPSAAVAGIPELAESSAASSNRRGSAASVPAGSDASGSSAVADSLAENGQISRAAIPRSGNVGSRPAPDNTQGQQPMKRRGDREALDAVGATANEVDNSTVGSSGPQGGEAMIAKPAGIPVGRQASSIPSSAAANGGGPAGPASSADFEPGPAKALIAALTARGTEPTTSPGANNGFADGVSPRLEMSRSSASTGSLSAGAMAAEQTGTLVFAGPQAAAMGDSIAGRELTGPRLKAVPRRAAGLPGSNGSAADSGTLPETGISQPSRVAVGSPRATAGGNQPALAPAEIIAGMIRKSMPKRGGSPEARIAESLSMRTSEARREAARTLGGSEESEDAVERGLAWLALNQYPDGHWSIDDFPGEPVAGLGQGSFRADSAATGLALLAFLGAGYTHQSGAYRDEVNRGVTWLINRQKPDGDLFADQSEFVWFYSHGMASIALCEAYGLTKDTTLREPAQKALNFIVQSQHPEFGGWRYRPRFESDTSVSGWQLMALKSGEMSGLAVPKEAYVRVNKWLDSVQSKTSPGQFAYHPSRDVSLSMTAEGLLMRQYLGARRNDAQLIAGARFLRTRLPDSGQRDAYYWYYATQVMFHMQGEYWEAWNNMLRDALVESQAKNGPESGSWDPARPTPDKWSSAGGRHYLTCLNLLMLEVYYRHLPLYLELEK